ncbi:class I SAM-dependent methyltransferase [Mesorhizobium sp. M4A.F.Ca.ET.029.04.2.1]|nr:class I SAM-dependent methyltransferase [Mesorhizobium sp. M4A.F.Ca.ET.029.04.2.1]
MGANGSGRSWRHRQCCGRGRGVLPARGKRPDWDVRVALRAGAIACGDLSEPPPFNDGCFDLILASLVMHYRPDWSGRFSEFTRLLPRSGQSGANAFGPGLTPSRSRAQSGWRNRRSFVPRN